MDIVLNEVEVRILGCLMEKALSTPDLYPLSLNALTNACNQKSSRNPVVSYDETTVQSAVDSLTEKSLVHESNVSRVSKYEELLSSKRQFVPRETAILCVLLLRGPQTVGEIRSRTSRLHAFESLDEVQATLTNLKEWGLIQRLERQPGRKESRYGHLFSVESEAAETEPASQAASVETPLAEKVAQLEAEVSGLQAGLAELKTTFESFKAQFE